MQTAGHRIAASTKLATSVQNGHHYFDGGFALGRVDIHGDATPVVNDTYTALGRECDLDVVAVASKSFINRVVDHFVHQMVQTAGTRGPNVHTRAFTDGF